MSDEQKADVVEYVFKRLAAIYGAAWDRSLGQAPIGDVMTVWAYQLQQFTVSIASKKMVMWALDNLPDRCPNVLEFKTLCRRAPVAQIAALPEPASDPERMAEELAKLAPFRVRTGVASAVDHKAWARCLQARDAAGEPLNMNQRRCYREALGINESSALMTKEAFLDAMGAA